MRRTTALLVGFSPVWMAGGCEYNPASLPESVVGPIEANAVECDCRFAESGTRTLRVRANPGDGEETTDGDVDLTSDDLDLGEKHVGLRFAEFGLPPGAVITGAHVEFTADESQEDPTEVEIRAQVTANAPVFTTTAGHLTSRTPVSAVPVAWPIDPWTADTAQASPDLSSLVQELVELPDWTSASAVVLLFGAGDGHRTAYAFDQDPARAPELVVTFETELAAVIPTCATDLDRDENGFLTTPQASCDTPETTLGGLGAACTLPQTVTCTAVDRKDPSGDDIPDSFESDACEEPCPSNPVDSPACTEYDPVAVAACLAAGTALDTCIASHASATHAGIAEPVCVASGSPLAFHALGRRSRCEVEGTSAIEIGDREPKKDPATAGGVDLLGGPCDTCPVLPFFLFDMEPITFEVRWARDPTFVNLGSAGRAREPSILDGGIAGFDPGSVDGTGWGRRGGDGLAIRGSNTDVLDLGIDWAGRTCDLAGTLAVGVGDDGLCEADGETPCRSDEDCAAVGGACDLPPVDDAEMSVSLFLAGTLVNQPPDAFAGADQTVECTSPDGAGFLLDGRGSTDPDGNIAVASWRLGGRTGPEIAADLEVTRSLGVGESESAVLRVIDTFGQLDEDATSVSVVDTTPPDVSCNTPATIRPRDAEVGFTATAVDTCDASVPAVVTSYDCHFINPAGRRVSKLESCEVTFAGDTLRVLDSGGVGDHITWTVEATDDSGNVGRANCEVVVVR